MQSRVISPDKLLRSDCPIFVEERVFIKYAQQREEEKQNRGTSLEDMEPSGSA